RPTPAVIRTMAVATRPATRPPKSTRAWRQGVTCWRISRLIRPSPARRGGLGVRTGVRISSSLAMVHKRAPDCVAINRRGELGGDAPAVHDPDAIGEEQDLVEVLADQEHARAAIARDPQALVHRRRRPHVEPPAGAVSEDDTGRAGKLARDDQFLSV